MTDLAEQIVALIVEETGVKRKRVQLTSRLAQDIRMDGDDAVEFFEKFGEKFNVDLTTLHNHWHSHFVPEGGGLSPGCTVVIGVGVIAGGVLHAAVEWIPAWAAMIVFVGVLSWVYSKFFNDHKDVTISVTVQDLVDAATLGKWVRQYEEPAPSLFRTLE
jgi:acyl carrier protein